MTKLYDLEFLEKLFLIFIFFLSDQNKYSVLFSDGIERIKNEKEEIPMKLPRTK
jgi:hypothetical protein